MWQQILWEAATTGIRKICSPLQHPNYLVLHFVGFSLYWRNLKFRFLLTTIYCRGENTQRKTRMLIRGPYHFSLWLVNGTLSFPFSSLSLPFFFPYFPPKVPFAIKSLCMLSTTDLVIQFCVCKCTSFVHQCHLHAIQIISGQEIQFANKLLKFHIQASTRTIFKLCFSPLVSKLCKKKKKIQTKTLAIHQRDAESFEFSQKVVNSHYGITHVHKMILGIQGNRWLNSAVLKIFIYLNIYFTFNLNEFY